MNMSILQPVKFLYFIFKYKSIPLSSSVGQVFRYSFNFSPDKLIRGNQPYLCPQLLTFQFFNRKKYEGSNYLDGTNGIDLVDNAVSPGKLFKYIWQVPERAGPTENDGDCLAWAYYSDTFSVEDLYTGLVGPLIVCKKVNTYTRFVGDKGKRKKTRIKGCYNGNYFH